MTTITTLANPPAQWDGAAGAWLAEVAHRTGSPRTPEEYGRHLARFLELVGDPGQATAAHVHAFTYGTGPSGREPSPSTVFVRLAAVSGFCDFARRMGPVYRNPPFSFAEPPVTATRFIYFVLRLQFHGGRLRQPCAT